MGISIVVGASNFRSIQKRITIAICKERIGGAETVCDAVVIGSSDLRAVVQSIIVAVSIERIGGSEAV